MLATPDSGGVWGSEITSSSSCLLFRSSCISLCLHTSSWLAAASACSHSTSTSQAYTASREHVNGVHSQQGARHRLTQPASNGNPQPLSTITVTRSLNFSIHIYNQCCYTPRLFKICSYIYTLYVTVKCDVSNAFSS